MGMEEGKQKGRETEGKQRDEWVTEQREVDLTVKWVSRFGLEVGGPAHLCDGFST